MTVVSEASRQKYSMNTLKTLPFVELEEPHYNKDTEKR